VPVIGTKPDLRPGRVLEVRFADRGLQGSAKEDSVIVWFWRHVSKGSRHDWECAHLGVELKLDDGARSGSDVIRVVLQAAVGIRDGHDLDNKFARCCCRLSWLPVSPAAAVAALRVAATGAPFAIAPGRLVAEMICCERRSDKECRCK
jgi:hypothetical protein